MLGSPYCLSLPRAKGWPDPTAVKVVPDVPVRLFPFDASSGGGSGSGSGSGKKKKSVWRIGTAA